MYKCMILISDDKGAAIYSIQSGAHRVSNNAYVEAKDLMDNLMEEEEGED